MERRSKHFVLMMFCVTLIAAGLRSNATTTLALPPNKLELAQVSLDRATATSRSAEVDSTPTPTLTPPPTATTTPTPTPTRLPPANQLVNPCFHGVHSDAPPGWEQTGGWDVSMYKNPCGPNGTAGRINDPEHFGESAPDTDERLWQVVPGQGAYLVAEMQCVHHFAYYTDMNIYGSDSPDGRWALVWTPFTLADCDQDRWGAVRHAETQLGQDYAYYKVEFAAMYATVQGGVKFTNAYFASLP